jgi:hypothetical protein
MEDVWITLFLATGLILLILLPQFCFSSSAADLEEAKRDAREARED